MPVLHRTHAPADRENDDAGRDPPGTQERQFPPDWMPPDEAQGLRPAATRRTSVPVRRVVATRWIFPLTRSDTVHWRAPTIAEELEDCPHMAATHHHLGTTGQDRSRAAGQATTDTANPSPSKMNSATAPAWHSPVAPPAPPKSGRGPPLAL